MVSDGDGSIGASRVRDHNSMMIDDDVVDDQALTGSDFSTSGRVG